MKNILGKNLLILASAGSGKTFQLGNRVIGLVARGVDPEKIVALTFTRKAAGEFADSVLTKLADAARDDAAAERLRADLNLPEADFKEALERVVRALPRFMLGTMDGFFARVVRGFQYELGLTGGKFDLLEGPRAVAMTDGILAGLLGESLEAGSADDFLHAFRRASYGKEGQRVIDGLRDFVGAWHSRFRTAAHLDWGPAALSDVTPEHWEERKHPLVAKVQRGLDGIEYGRKDQRPALEKLIAQFTGHTIGSGSLGTTSTKFWESVLESAMSDGPMRLSYFKEFLVGGPAGEALRELVHLAARCEMAAALRRTTAVRELVGVYDSRCESDLRRRGLLAFDDVKLLMGEWATSETARLRRELVDFRLDARHEHWLLDEFQDTSRAEWTGLFPLLDEASGAGDGSLFIVGDRKQAIYAWRGGEVKLFDDVIRHYGPGLAQEIMSESWRSCPEVLALVNRVCGDKTTLRELFGEAAELWDWPDHVAAPPLAHPTRHGEARVEVVEGKWEARLERLSELLVELGAGQRPMTCGVLVRQNSKVREIADHLRAAGLDVIEEGRREPAKDNPVGIALGQLLNWLADPADAFSREVVWMSPLGPALDAAHGGHWQQVWEKLLGRASEAGFAGMLEEVVELQWAGWSDFGRRRAGDIIAALADLDSRGGATPREAAEWIERLEVSQNPGVAAVQVMTIHKAKGLGFDIVILPDIPNDRVPNSGRFDIAEGDGWITQPPPKWARALIPEMRESEARWEITQRYEAFCMLYVALTRAKRGLYVLLEPPAKTQGEDKASLANWLATAVGSDGKPGIVYQSGRAEWIETLPNASTPKEATPLPTLADAVPRRERTTPSGTKNKSGATHSAAGLKFGSEVHAAFECVGWIDEEIPNLPANDGGEAVRKLLQLPNLRELFQRGGRPVDLLREQPVEAVVAGSWLSGIIDRLHLHRGSSGAVVRVEIIDFKTDSLDDLSELAARYTPQMDAYRGVLELAYPGAEISCLLVSTRHGACIAV